MVKRNPYFHIRPELHFGDDIPFYVQKLTQSIHRGNLSPNLYSYFTRKLKAMVSAGDRVGMSTEQINHAILVDFHLPPFLDLTSPSDNDVADFIFDPVSVKRIDEGEWGSVSILLSQFFDVPTIRRFQELVERIDPRVDDIDCYEILDHLKREEDLETTAEVIRMEWEQ